MSKKKWSVDDVADACSCQTQKVWMWQSITSTIITCNTWKSRSDVLVKDKLSLVLQHPFTFGWVQPLLGHMRNQEWSPDKWFLLLKRGAKTSAVLFLSCKAPSDVFGPLNLWKGVHLQEWLCTHVFFPWSLPLLQYRILCDGRMRYFQAMNFLVDEKQNIYLWIFGNFWIVS